MTVKPTAIFLPFACCLCLSLALPMGSGFAVAQTAEPAVPAQPASPTLDPKACADQDRMRLDAQGNEVRAPNTGEPLSDRLARTGSVICPPPTLDPDIRAPAPDTGTMPVIPPPAAPGEPQTRP